VAPLKREKLRGQEAKVEGKETGIESRDGKNEWRRNFKLEDSSTKFVRKKKGLKLGRLKDSKKGRPLDTGSKRLFALAEIVRG